MNNPKDIPLEDFERLKDCFPTVMHFIKRLDFGIGWMQLFNGLCLRLEMLSNSLPDEEKFYITCAKEKFGKLTVYIGNDKQYIGYVNQDAFDIIREYSDKSLEICEYTGEKGSTYILPNKIIKIMTPQKAEELNATLFDRKALFSFWGPNTIKLIFGD